MTTIKKEYTYNGRKVTFSGTTYREPETLAVLMYDKKYKEDEVITVNLCDMLQGDSTAYVDTNNHPGIDRWLEENGLAESTGMIGVSGFCTYPLMAFNRKAWEE